MLTKIYYDSFTNEYCLPSEEDFGVAPPERYLATYKGYDNCYIETWDVSSDHGDRLEIAYTADDYADKSIVAEIQRAMEENYHCKLRSLLRWCIPAEKFDEYCKRFHLK